jgi:type III restriction enzyme
VRAIATSVAQYVTIKTFATVLRRLVVEELSPVLDEPARRLSETEPFPFSRPTFEADKTVFTELRGSW